MGRRCRWNGLIILGLSVMAQSASAAPCADAVFPVEGQIPTLPEDIGPLSIRFDGHDVALDPICPATPTRTRVTPRGLSMRARWTDCTGIEKGVRLRMQATRDCRRARGVIRSAQPRAKLRFRSTRPSERPMPGGARIREGFETRLRQSGGCGDALLFARNSRDSMVLFVSAHQIAERAHEAGGPTTFSLDVASEEISLWLQRGRNLSHAACNDALSRQTRVSLEYQARSGHVSVTVTPTGTPTAQGEYPAEAILRIEDAVLTPAGDPNGEPVHLDGFELEARIGWLPG